MKRIHFILLQNRNSNSSVFVLLWLCGDGETLACGGELDRSFVVGGGGGGGGGVCIVAKYVRGLAGM